MCRSSAVVRLVVEAHSGDTPSVFPLDLVFFSFHLVFQCFFHGYLVFFMSELNDN